jgi:hypothetical protein
MIKYLRAALRSPLTKGDPTSEEVSLWRSTPHRLSDAAAAELKRRGNPFRKSGAPKQALAPAGELALAMNRSNPKNKLSAKTLAELERLRKEKLAS